MKKLNLLGAAIGDNWLQVFYRGQDGFKKRVLLNKTGVTGMEELAAELPSMTVEQFNELPDEIVNIDSVHTLYDESLFKIGESDGSKIKVVDKKEYPGHISHAYIAKFTFSQSLNKIIIDTIWGHRYATDEITSNAFGIEGGFTRIHQFIADTERMENYDSLFNSKVVQPGCAATIENIQFDLPPLTDNEIKEDKQL